MKKIREPRGTFDGNIKLDGWLKVLESSVWPLLLILSAALSAGHNSNDSQKVLERISLRTPNGEVRSISVDDFEKVLNEGMKISLNSFLELGLTDLATEIDLSKNDYHLEFNQGDKTLGYIEIIKDGGIVRFNCFILNERTGTYDTVDSAEFAKLFTSILESDGNDIKLNLNQFPRKLDFLNFEP